MQARLSRESRRPTAASTVQDDPHVTNALQYCCGCDLARVTGLSCALDHESPHSEGFFVKVAIY